MKTSKASKPTLYSHGRILSFKRGKHLQHPHTVILSLEDVNDSSSAKFYQGKRVAYVYRSTKAHAVSSKSGAPGPVSPKTGKPKMSRKKVIWGKITRVHGNSGAVRAKFARNLPSQCFGSAVRIMLYPSNI